MNLYDMNVVRPILAKHGFHFSKSMGQNFLIARWVPERIVREACLVNNSGVLEIGPGIGVLTQELAKTASKVVAVELDKKLIPLLRETLSDCENVVLMSDNILKVDLKALVEEHLSGLSPCVCANLPYNITTPILSVLIDSGCFEKITVMVQKEVAKRICSKPGTADYGAFTVYVNYYSEPEILFDVPPDCFFPMPKVTSSVITLTRREKPDYVEDEALFFRTVKASFAQRRKMLVNALFSGFGEKLEKNTLSDILIKCGFDEKIRGENLGIPEFARISNEIGRRMQIICGD